MDCYTPTGFRYTANRLELSLEKESMCKTCSLTWARIIREGDRDDLKQKQADLVRGCEAGECYCSSGVGSDRKNFSEIFATYACHRLTGQTDD